MDDQAKRLGIGEAYGTQSVFMQSQAMREEPPLERAIRMDISEQIQQIAQQELQKSQENMRVKLAEIVASVAITLYEHISFERIGPDLVIHIKAEGLKK